jgi:HJR/Mrr/RecB family endonuclease
MAEPTKYYAYKPGTSCSVKGCGSPAEFEVYLYDYYPLPWDNNEFFEQDHTCPFLCHKHMEENEERAKGVRQPRGFVIYPFTNQHGAQGYSKYAPVSEAFPLIIDVSRSLDQRNLVSSYASVNDDLIAYLAANPRALRELTPRFFEEVVAELFRKRGFVVELTPRTRDGGYDVLAVQSDALGKSLYLIECKRYAASRKVGVEAIRGLYGVLQSARGTRGIIVTTSSYTKAALAFATPLEYQLSLRDFDALKEWLSGFRTLKG